MPGVAIEAVRLLTDPSETTIHGYRLRDIEITNALTIPDSSTGVEVQLCLRPCSEKELDYKDWYDFEIYSIAGKKASWLQHCKGFVTAETIVSTKPAATTTEVKAPHSDSFFTPGVKVAGVDTESVFARLRAMTIFHGPAFQNLISSQKASNKNITTLAISPATLDCDETYILHPTTLDSLIVAAYISVPEITAEGSMVIPRSIRRLLVPRGTNRQTGDKLKAFIELQKANKHGAKLTSIAMNENDEEESTSLLRMEDLYLQTVALDEANSANVKDPALCSESRWELDILHEFPSKLKDTMRINLDDAHVEFEKKLNRVSYNFIHDAVAKLEGSENIKNWQPQHKSFYDWMKSVVEKGKAGELGPGSRSWSKSNKGIRQRLADDLEAESAAGKILTHIGRNLASIVRVEIEPLVLMMQDGLMNQYLDDTSSTYMIAGGVGGIGNAIAELMIEKGAKNILIVSRNAESHPKATPLIHKAKAEGCHVYIRNCDISDEGSLVKLLADCTGKIPPIRGVIQAAMALDDTILESLTFGQWKRGVMSKVAGSLNLHNHVPDPKFFVMLSSVVGVVGHTSQSNYAAGNTFQDALARHRTANGLPAVAIDLGAVGSVGVVAEANDNMLERVERNLGSKVIPIEKVLLLIEAAMREPFRKNPDQSQVITGILEYDRIPEDSSIKKDKRFGTLRLENSSNNASESTKGAARSSDEVLKHALTMTTPTSPETANLVSDALVHKLANIFNIVEAEIDTGLGLSTLGVDSLVAVELRNWLSSVVQAKVTVFEILQSATVKDFAGLVVGRSALID
jgi:NAD(P)-dependent dehydrogenase (short-subunit alcohol dehydrogenase family)